MANLYSNEKKGIFNWAKSANYMLFFIRLKI